jgi:hypothetical protein
MTLMLDQPTELSWPDHQGAAGGRVKCGAASTPLPTQLLGELAHFRPALLAGAHTAS